MKKQVIVMEFKDAHGNVVPTLSKEVARPEEVMAALQFLAVGCSLTISVEEIQIDVTPQN